MRSREAETEAAEVKAEVEESASTKEAIEGATAADAEEAEEACVEGVVVVNEEGAASPTVAVVRDVEVEVKAKEGRCPTPLMILSLPPSNPAARKLELK